MHFKAAKIAQMAAGFLALIVLVFATVAYLGQSAGTLVGLVVVGFAALVVTLSPTHVLPLLALIAYALMSQRMLPGPLFLVVSPGGLILLVWLIRRRRYRHVERVLNRPRWALCLLSMIVIWSTFTLIWSVNLLASLGWIVSVILCMVVPLLVPPTQREVSTLLNGWSNLGAFLGVYALLERLIGENVIFDVLYNLSGGGWDIQHWSTYRSHVSFGHPLYAGMFLGVCTAISAGLYFETGRKKFLLSGGFAFVGVAATVSRSSLIATVAAVGFIVLINVAKESERSRFRALLGGGLVAAATVMTISSSGFIDRLAAREADLSTGYRTWMFEVVLAKVDESNWIGVGAGASKDAFPQSESLVTYVESSPLQVLLSLGIVGLVLFFLLIVTLVYQAIRTSNLAAAGGMIALVIAISGYNAIDDQLTSHILFGLLSFLCLAPNGLGESGTFTDGHVGEPVRRNRRRRTDVR